MTMADRLGIAPGSLIWLIGDNVEGASLLDPLPEGAQLYEDEPASANSTSNQSWQDDTWGASFPDATAVDDREPERPHGVDVAVLVVGNSQQLTRQLDEVLPRVGSIPVMWVCAPSDEISHPIVQAAVEDYGWALNRELSLTDAWSAWSIGQG